MRRVLLACGLTALLASCSSSAPDPCATCMGTPSGTIGPFVNESSAAVFLGSAAPPKDLALESLTLTENAELLLPQVFDQTPVVTKVAPGGVIALASSMMIVAATATSKATARVATLVSFIGSGSEGRFLLVGNESAIGNAALREVGGELTVVPLDPNVTVIPVRQTSRPACKEGELAKKVEWTDRMGTATIATQSWSDGCIDVTFTDSADPFRACLPEDAWLFQEGRALTFNLFASQSGLAHTNGAGERGISITDGGTMLELALVKAPLTYAPPIDAAARLEVVATKTCVSVDRTCPRIATPIGITLVEDGVKQPIELGAPFTRDRSGQLVTHRIVGGRVTPVRRLDCEGDASGYVMERVTVRRPSP